MICRNPVKTLDPMDFYAVNLKGIPLVALNTFVSLVVAKINKIRQNVPNNMIKIV